MSLSDTASAVAPWVALLTALGTTAGTVLAFTSPKRASARLRADIRSDVELLSSLDPGSSAAYDMNEVVAAQITELANRVAYRRVGLLTLYARLGGIGLVAGAVYVALAMNLPDSEQIAERLAGPSTWAGILSITGLLMILASFLCLTVAGALGAFFWLHAHLPEAFDVFLGQWTKVKKDRERRRALSQHRKERAEAAKQRAKTETTKESSQ